MSLTLPPSFTLNNLIGGYQGQLDYTMLADNQTNDGRNVEIGYTVKRRSGYTRLYKSALTKTGIRATTGETGAAVTGHFHLVKAAGTTDIDKHVVCAGPNVWNYSSGTANIILTNLTDGQDIVWNFAQIMNPADGSDDVVIGTNGKDKPIIWNGTDASAAFLDSVSGASGVVPAKYLVSLKNRIILLNVNDPSDVDAGSKFIMSSFDSAGAPAPHIFPAELSVYAGGSDRYGEITGAASINGRMIIFKKNTHYLFTLGGATVDDTTLSLLHDFSLQQMDENIGCIAPKTIQSIGNIVMFLSDKGVYATDGTQLVYMSEPIKRDLDNINLDKKYNACAVFHREKNQYWLSVAESGKNYNNMVFVYDVDKKIWFTPYDNMRCNIMSNFVQSNKQRILCGDHMGYLFELDNGVNDGRWSSKNFKPKSMLNNNTLIVADADRFEGNWVTDDMNLGLSIRALEASGANGEYRTIINCTASQLTVSPDWNTEITTNTTFALMSNKSYLRTKDFDFGNADLDKVFYKINARTTSDGDYDIKMNYVIDFNDMTNAGTASISVYDSRFLTPTDFDQATGTIAVLCGTVEAPGGPLQLSSVNVSNGTDLSASNLAGFCVYFQQSIILGGGRVVRPITSGECNTLNLGLVGTASLTNFLTSTIYMINRNLQNTWGTALWGPAKNKSREVSVRCLNNQPPVGKHLAVIIGNERANETWELFGLDIITKTVGRR
jgi:hypothetical protein